MATSTIRYLDTPETIVVETPIQVSIGWGDRAAGTQGDMLPVWATIDDIQVTVDGTGAAKAARKVNSDWYSCKLPHCAGDVIAAHRAVNDAAATAERDNPAIAAACAGFRAIVARILQEHDENLRMWRDVWTPALARKFRRQSVEIGEQTVPGKRCVRSARGKLLGYAECWDGRWLGTIERL